MRTAATNTALAKSLSTERLEKYLVAASGDLHNCLTLYERNARLSESFYTPLQCLEVCLRNSLHRELTTAYGVKWYLPDAAPLLPNSRDDVNKVLGELGAIGKPILPGAVVAELKFGFWVGLLAQRYDATLWRKALFKAIRVRSKRDHIHGRFNALRRFRNRVAHHEPIFQKDLSRTHTEIVEALSWMCADTAAWAKFHSRFSTVYDGT